MSLTRLLLMTAAISLFALACGGGGDDAASTVTQTASEAPSASVEETASPEASEVGGSGAPADLCALLPEATVRSVTTYGIALAQPHNGPGPLHFCTIYLDISACEMQCAVSIEDLGAVDPNHYNTPDAFKDGFLSANPDANATFEDEVLGENSWLAVARGGEIPGYKLAYFQVHGIAYDFHGPLVPDYVLTEGQIIDMANAIIENLQ